MIFPVSTLETIHGMPRGHDSDINANLGVNRGNSGDKEFIAMAKILHVHNHFNMQPFFEWEFKVLPLMFEWKEKRFSLSYQPRGITATYCKSKSPQCMSLTLSDLFELLL